MFNLPDLNVTGFESKAYIRYYAGGLCVFHLVSITKIGRERGFSHLNLKCMEN